MQACAAKLSCLFMGLLVLLLQGLSLLLLQALHPDDLAAIVLLPADPKRAPGGQIHCTQALGMLPKLLQGLLHQVLEVLRQLQLVVLVAGPCLILGPIRSLRILIKFLDVRVQLIHEPLQALDLSALLQRQDHTTRVVLAPQDLASNLQGQQVLVVPWHQDLATLFGLLVLDEPQDLVDQRITKRGSAATTS